MSESTSSALNPFPCSSGVSEHLVAQRNGRVRDGRAQFLLAKVNAVLGVAKVVVEINRGNGDDLIASSRPPCRCCTEAVRGASGPAARPRKQPPSAARCAWLTRHAVPGTTSSPLKDAFDGTPLRRSHTIRTQSRTRRSEQNFRLLPQHLLLHRPRLQPRP